MHVYVKIKYIYTFKLYISMCIYRHVYVYKLFYIFIFIWFYIGICIKIIYKYLGNICQNNCIFVIIDMYTFRYICIYIEYLCVYVFNIYIELCLYFYINILVRILTCRHQYNKQIRTSNINIGNVNMKHSNPNIEQNESTDFMPVRAALLKPNMSEKWVKRFYANLSKTSSPNPMKKAHFPRN